jgi:tetratricopeptide (TPR) repeat protein
LIALRVEANLGLNRTAEAEKLLPAAGDPPGDFFIAAAQAIVYRSMDWPDDALVAFLRAAEFAQSQGDQKLVVWAWVQSAGVMIDSGELDRAVPHLDAASKLDATNVDLVIHRVKVLDARRQWAKALSDCEHALHHGFDPALSAQAASLARRLGDTPRFQEHFAAAEAAYQRALDAGEVFSLGALARLYGDCNVQLDRAEELAKKNLTFQRDRQATATLELIQKKRRAADSGR